MATEYRPTRRDRMRIRHFRDVLVRLRELAAPEGARILDLGGGTGAPASVFGAGAREIVVIEPNERKISNGRAAGAPVTFVSGVAESLPYGPGQFDRVVSLMSFHHFSNADAALREAARVLAPGGRFVLYDFDRSNWRARLFAFFEETFRRHPGRFAKPGELEQRFVAAGFVHVRREPFRAGAFVLGDR